MKKIFNNQSEEELKNVSLNSRLAMPLLALFVSVITACSSVPFNSGTEKINQGNPDKTVKVLSGQNENSYVLDLGYPGGASFGAKINIEDGTGFKTLANQDGHKFVRADVDTVRVFLSTTTGTGDLSGTLTPIAAMPPAGYFQLTKDTSGDIEVLFINVPNNAVYRVAVCALTTTALGLNPDGSAWFPSPRDITKPTNDFGTITLNSNENTYILSNSGGDKGCGGSCTNNVGFIGIDASGGFISNPQAPDEMEVPITLIAADGATIDSTVNVTDGSLTVHAVTMQ